MRWRERTQREIEKLQRPRPPLRAARALVAVPWAGPGEPPRDLETAGRAVRDWLGVEPVWVARDGQDVADHMAALTPELAAAIGRAALARVKAEHTYALRGAQVDALFKAHARQPEEAGA